MRRYLHNLPDWPAYTWDSVTLEPLLSTVRYRQGQFAGRMAGLGFNFRSQALLSTLTQDVVKSSAIEGERLDPATVRSSVARRLGLDVAALYPSDRPDRQVEGVVKMLVDATTNVGRPLTQERLFQWHVDLFPLSRSGHAPTLVGQWRDDRTGPMQVVSGFFGGEQVHYEAPPANRVEEEMDRFLAWFDGEQAVEPLLKAGIAHLWFVTIHPFADGNGRIGRAIADLQLARSEQSAQRYYSLSAQIQAERSAYYDMLELTQAGTMNVTDWLVWFLECLVRAIDAADRELDSVFRRAQLWERFAGPSFNDRQRHVLSRLIDGFEGKLTNAKWAKLTKSSPDTALRDLTDLVERGILVKDPAGGRSTSYSLAPLDPKAEDRTVSARQ